MVEGIRQQLDKTRLFLMIFQNRSVYHCCIHQGRVGVRRIGLTRRCVRSIALLIRLDSFSWKQPDKLQTPSRCFQVGFSRLKKVSSFFWPLSLAKLPIPPGWRFSPTRCCLLSIAKIVVL